MKTVRTSVLVALVLAVFVLLAVKNNREKAETARVDTEPAVVGMTDETPVKGDTEPAAGKTDETPVKGNADETRLSPAEQKLADAKKNKQPAWLLIHSTSCGPCIAMEGIYKEVEPQYKGKAVFVKVNLDDPAETRIIENAKVDYIPKSIFYDKNGEVVESIVGGFPAEELKEKLDRLAGK